MRDVVAVVLPSPLLLREFGSSKSGAGVVSGGIDEDEEDRSAALAIVLLLVVKSAHSHAIEAAAKIPALRRNKSRLLIPVE